MKASGASSPARNDAGPNSSRSRTPEHFRLVGPSVRLDPRTHAVRKDVADVALAGDVFAPHYARPLDHGCVAAAVPMRGSPSVGASAVSELLHGETFAVVDCAGAWAWGYSRHDNYTGYVPLKALGPALDATHVVDNAAALVFADADIKSPVIERLPIGARIAVAGEDGAFLRIASGFVHRRHARPIGEQAADFVEVAARFMGAPYRWGGRSGDGIDCSGLVQMALALCGHAASRDSDQQLAALGTPPAPGAALRRGDLAFWPGHVGIMTDEARLLHANAHWMRVVEEPLSDVIARQPEDRRAPQFRRL